MADLTSIKILFSLVDSDYPYSVSVGEITKDCALLRSVIRLAEKNGLYYFISRLRGLSADISCLEKHRFEKEERKLSEFKENIIFLNKVFRDHKIDYILIKVCNTVPHVPRDVDLFVRKKDRKRIIEILKDTGMDVVQLGVAETSLKGKYMKVDLYTEICYFSVNFIEENFLWKSTVNAEIFGIGYTGLNKEASFLLMLIHSLFGHRSMTLLDFLHMQYLKKNILNIETCRKYASEKGWGFVFDSFLKKLDNLNERIYTKGETILFPYLFDRNFILKCLSGIEGLKINNYHKIFLYMALVQDRFIYELKDSLLYNMLNRFEPTRNLINSMTAYVKKMRGDKKSLNGEN